MPGLWKRQPNRRPAPARPRDRFRPYLEELEPRTVFAVGAAPFPGALAAAALPPPLVATAPSQVAIVSAPTATPAQSGLPAVTPAAPAAGATPLPANLGQPPAVPSGASPAPPVAAPTTTQAPAALSPNSTAPLSVLSYSGYQLTSGLNPSLAAGQLPTVLNTQAVNALFEVGGNATGAPTFSQAPAGAGTGAVVPVNAVLPLIVTPIDGNLGPVDDGLTAEGPLRFLGFHRPARPAADSAETQTEGPAAPQVPDLVGEAQAAVPAEVAAAFLADGDW